VPSATEVRLVAPAGAGRLDRFLADQLPDESRTRLAALVKSGAVTVDGARVRPSMRLAGGERILVLLPPPEPTSLEPEEIPLELLHVDADLVVVDKPAGMVVHPARGHRTGTMVHALLHHLPRLGQGGEACRPGIVHRLDKGTSGALVVARNDLALRRLQAAFSIHDVQREYLAVVYGEPRFLEGRIESSLGRHPRDRLRFTSVERGGRRAVTHWRRLSSAGGLCLLSCRLETGRTHQIRVHLLEQGHPVVGDPLYARGRRLPVAFAGWAERLEHQLLHARLLAFQHPIGGQQLAFDVPPPELFREFCDAVGLQVPES